MGRSVFLFYLVVCFLIASVASTEHYVGESTGWQIPPSKDFYQEWAKNRKFVVGDQLVFNYIPSAHNVLEITKQEFDACSQNDVISMHYHGNTVLDLNKPGMHYFYCGIGLHCEDGQKLQIEVQES